MLQGRKWGIIFGDTIEIKNVLLVAFYNIKALGVRYLESALRREGYKTVTVFYKGFNSIHPLPTNKTELKILTDIIEKEKPVLVGFSVMSSVHLETVNKVISAAKQCDDAFTNGDNWRDIPSLCYKESGKYAINPIGNILTEIDGYGLPAVECENALHIESGKVRSGDPQLGTLIMK